jgi:hypothetical protein
MIIQKVLNKFYNFALTQFFLIFLARALYRVNLKVYDLFAQFRTIRVNKFHK